MIPAALPELAGRLHPALVHLPIGFLLLLALAELAGWLRPAVRPPPALRTFALGASLAAACAAAACGWWLGREGDYEAALLERHRWAGVACTALTAALLILRRRPLPYALTFAGCLVALGTAGHLGGTLTHGEGYLWRVDPPASAARAAVTSAADRVPDRLMTPQLSVHTVPSPVTITSCASPDIHGSSAPNPVLTRRGGDGRTGPASGRPGDPRRPRGRRRNRRARWPPPARSARSRRRAP